MRALLLGVIASAIVVVPAAGREVGWHAMKAAALACSEQEDVKHIGAMRSSGDEQAWRRAAGDALASGKCIVLDRGTEVYVEDVAMFAGVAKVRARGSTAAYWIYYTYLD